MHDSGGRSARRRVAGGFRAGGLLRPGQGRARARGRLKAVAAPTLTIDVGSSAVKAALWDEAGLLAVGRAPLATTHPRPGWAEQSPDSWWRSVVAAAEECRETAAPAVWRAIDRVALTGARETFALVDAAMQPLGAAIVWSDRRASVEATELVAEAGGPEAVTARTGMPVDAGTMAAKVRWLARHDRARLDAARWLLSPRDLIAQRLAGDVATDWTMASRTALYELHGGWAGLAPDAVAARLPPIGAPVSVIGNAAHGGAELGLPHGAVVVIGAGDRAAEVLGSGSAAPRPMVSWGTTVNVSSPVDLAPDPVPSGAAVSRSGTGGFLVECGLSAGGASTRWLATVAGLEEAALAQEASDVAAGADGVVVVPWFNGARAPWWRPGATASVHGLRPAHTRGHLARAVYEGVAMDVARGLETQPAAPRTALAAAGGGAGNRLWLDILGAATALPVERRRHANLSASVGAALLAGYATGTAISLEDLNPVVEVVEPSAELVAAYAELRGVSDAAVARSLPPAQRAARAQAPAQ